MGSSGGEGKPRGVQRGSRVATVAAAVDDGDGAAADVWLRQASESPESWTRIAVLSAVRAIVDWLRQAMGSALMEYETRDGQETAIAVVCWEPRQLVFGFVSWTH